MPARGAGGGDERRPVMFRRRDFDRADHLAGLGLLAQEAVSGMTAVGLTLAGE